MHNSWFAIKDIHTFLGLYYRDAWAYKSVLCYPRNHYSKIQMIRITFNLLTGRSDSKYRNAFLLKGIFTLEVFLQPQESLSNVHSPVTISAEAGRLAHSPGEN